VTEEFLGLVAERFRVLGEPMRLRLLHCLIGGEKTVNALVEATGATQANVSRHLQTLTRAGILGRRKEGLHVLYRIEDASVFELCDHVCGSLRRDLEAKSRVLR
jgi:DNA-binding transcriptional ArsR family regulator